MSKNFTLAAQAALEPEDERKLPFQMAGDDTQLYAYEPSEGQLLILLGAIGSDSRSDAERSAEVLEVFWSVLSDETSRHLRGRLMDRRDAFGLGDVVHIIEWIVEEAAAHPTQSSPASLPTRATSGHLSTGGAPRGRSTRSRSAPVASTT